LTAPTAFYAQRQKPQKRRRAQAGLGKTPRDIAGTERNRIGSHKRRPDENAFMDKQKPEKSFKRACGKKYSACHCVVCEMLKILGYGLQADKKTLTVTESHVDRDAQFEYIDERYKEANSLGISVISIDAKKQEPILNFKNEGKTYQPPGNPIPVH
jgi:hypothetical protein